MSAPALFVCTEGGVYYSYDIVVGTEEVAEEKIDIEIYPNPVHLSESISVLLPSDEKSVNIQIYNNTGQTIFEKNFENITKQSLQFEIPFIASGIYYLQLTSATKQYRKKVLVN